MTPATYRTTHLTGIPSCSHDQTPRIAVTLPRPPFPMPTTDRSETKPTHPPIRRAKKEKQG